MINRILLLECEDINSGSVLRQKGVLEGTEGSKVLIIPWSTVDPRKEAKYRGLIKEYFGDLGIESIFLNRGDTSTQVEEKFGSVDIVYLLLLLREVKKRGVNRLIEGFKGVIIGNSAGALILSNYFLSSKREKLFYKGLGLVDFHLTVHYGKEKINDILELSYRREIIALSDGSSVIVRNSRIVRTWGRDLQDKEWGYS